MDALDGDPSRPAAPGDAAQEPTPQDPAAYDPAALKSSPGATAWHVVFGIFGSLLALTLVYGLVSGIILVFAPDSALATEIGEALRHTSAAALWAQVAFLAIFMGAIPLAWTVGTRVGGWRGAALYLGWRRPDVHLLYGALGGVGLAIAIGGLLLLYEGLGGSLPDSAAYSFEHLLTWPLVFALALAAGICEEILFRGILQRWIGLWGQAAVFSIAHASGGLWIQLLVTFGAGLLLGWLRPRWGLGAAMMVHLFYDLTLLAGAKAAL